MLNLQYRLHIDDLYLLYFLLLARGLLAAEVLFYLSQRLPFSLGYHEQNEEESERAETRIQPECYR